MDGLAKQKRLESVVAVKVGRVRRWGQVTERHRR